MQWLGVARQSRLSLLLRRRIQNCFPISRINRTCPITPFKSRSIGLPEMSGYPIYQELTDRRAYSPRFDSVARIIDVPFPPLRRVVSALCLSVLLSSFPLVGAPRDKAYVPKSPEEVDVLSLVIASEIKANNWTGNEPICLSVDGMNPSSRLLKALHRRGLAVRSSGEWAKKFNCGFELQLEYTQYDLSRTIKVRSKVIDLRDINKGEGDLALIEKDGEYSIQKIDGKWSISGYDPKAHSASSHSSR
jgi:hypothetical protein